MMATPSDNRAHSPITTFLENESEFVARFGNTNINTNTSAMSKLSAGSDFTAPTVLMSDLNLVECEDRCPSGSLSSNSRSNSSSVSGRSLANAIANANANANATNTSIETPFNTTPYIVEENRAQRGIRQVLAQKQQQQQPKQPPQNQQLPNKPIPHRANCRQESQRIPRVTRASIPFHKTIPPTSFLRDELAKDPAYRHALKAGTLWQSLVGQHVKLPALWYDGEEPARPYLGCEDPLKRNRWSYFGRHRVAGDPKLNAIVKNSRSSGKLLLHIVCRDSQTLEPTEDIVVGVFHPNAEGVREVNSAPNQERHEDYRDIWIGHRSRGVAHKGRRIATRIESLLRYLHRNKVDKSPLGSDDAEGSRSKRSVDNTNINIVFGSRPPMHTLFVLEEKLHGLLLPPQARTPSPPASVVLLRNFLR
jgi:hypothetical protein